MYDERELISRTQCAQHCLFQAGLAAWWFGRREGGERDQPRQRSSPAPPPQPGRRVGQRERELQVRQTLPSCVHCTLKYTTLSHRITSYEYGEYVPCYQCYIGSGSYTAMIHLNASVRDPDHIYPVLYSQSFLFYISLFTRILPVHS